MKATQYQIDKAIMILDNTYSLYEREQAIFKTAKTHANLLRLLKDFSIDVVAKTNLLEAGDPFMYGQVFDEVAQAVYEYMQDEYVIFLNDQKIEA